MVINLRNSSQPEDTETVDVRALISVSVAHFSSALSPAIVPTIRETMRGLLLYKVVHVYCTFV